MRLYLISCRSIALEVEACLASSPHQIDCDFVDKSAHNHPASMRETIQARILAAESRGYAAVLLGYGLCGNGIQGLKAASLPLIIPRAHDCATLFLGSRRRFEQLFRQSPSTPYSSAGYMASDGEALRENNGGAGPGLEELIRRYGEEDGREVWEAMHPKASSGERLAWFSLPETENPACLSRCRELAAAQGRDLVVEPGDIRLIKRLLHGDWNDAEFLTVPPGKSVEPAWDWNRVLKLKED